MPPLIPLAEQRPARKALERLTLHLGQRRIKPRIKPFPTVFLHGRPGTGKSALFAQLLEEATALDPGLICRSMPAREFAELLRHEPEAEAIQEELRQTDLLILEDLQFFPAYAAETLANIADEIGQRGGYFLASAVDGPMTLSPLPQRLRSRLAAGLVIRLETLGVDGRRRVAERSLKRRKVAVAPDLLDHLAGLDGECRETVGRVARLETLARLVPVPLRLSDVLTHLAPAPQPAGVSIERIVALVAKELGTDAAEMRSKARHYEVTWARQVAMHLARELTGKTLVEIGRHFGGRDHSTVLHALAKVADRMRDDPTARREIERWTKEAK